MKTYLTHSKLSIHSSSYVLMIITTAILPPPCVRETVANVAHSVPDLMKFAYSEHGRKITDRKDAITNCDEFSVEDTCTVALEPLREVAVEGITRL